MYRRDLGLYRTIQGARLQPVDLRTSPVCAPSKPYTFSRYLPLSMAGRYPSLRNRLALRLRIHVVSMCCVRRECVRDTSATGNGRSSRYWPALCSQGLLEGAKRVSASWAFERRAVHGMFASCEL